MCLDRFISKFQIVILDVQFFVLGRDYQFIEFVYLMIVLLNQQGGIVCFMLDQVGVNVNVLCFVFFQVIERLFWVEGIGGEVQLGKDSVVLFNLCDKIVQQCKDDYIIEYLLI